MISLTRVAATAAFALATVTSTFAAEPATQQQPEFEQQQLFKAGHEGYRTYRIPSLVCTSKGTLLAAVAARYDGHGDWADIDTMIRRSTDGGKTWTDQEIVTSDGVNTVDNATFVVDPKSNRIALMYQINYARAYVKFSDDEGERWSAPQDITNTFDVFRDRDNYNWEVIAMGPGHGITLRTGRMVVPVWLSTSHKHRPSIVATIYSDDRGKTWKAGQVISQNTKKVKNPSEHVLVELADGRVMANIRSESRDYRRMVSISDDGISGWTNVKPDADLIEPICMASMTRYSGKADGEHANTLLFCNPNSTEPRKRGSKWGARARQNVTVRLSNDGGDTWSQSRVIEPGPSGYSDIAVGPDRSIYVLYESGKVNDEGAFIPGYVTLAKFNMAWLQQGDNSE